MKLALMTNTITMSLFRLGVAFTLLLVLNLPFFLLGFWYSFSRPLINVEVLAPILLIRSSPYLALCSFFILWGIEFIAISSSIYWFRTPLEYLESSRYLHNISITHLMRPNIVIGAISFIIICSILIYISRRSILSHFPAWRVLISHLIAVNAVVALIDISNGSSMFSKNGVLHYPINIAGAPVFKLTKNVIQVIAEDNVPGGFAQLKSNESMRQFIAFDDLLRSNKSRSIVLIIVESLGIHNSERVKSALLETLYDQDVKSIGYKLFLGKIPFRGSTTYAELRELCGLYGYYGNLTENHTDLCLPKIAYQNGWTVSGLHGFHGSMFNRRHWWTHLGINNILFLEDFPKEAPKCGGAFAGVCDRYVISKAFDIASSGRQFVYALTLNSHLPLEPTILDIDIKRLCDDEKISETDCQLIQSHFIVFRSIRNSILELRKDQKPYVIVVGDHAPSYMDTELREGYSQIFVPGFLLEPQFNSEAP